MMSYETVFYILCDCECLASTKAQILRNYFIKLDELAQIPLKGLIRFIRRLGLTED